MNVPVDGLPFEEGLRELEEIVERLEKEGLALAESVDLYERGRVLARYCQTLLDAAALRVEQVVPDADGSTHRWPFAISDNDRS